jgi:hypothetical protein
VIHVSAPPAARAAPAWLLPPAGTALGGPMPRCVPTFTAVALVLAAGCASGPQSSTPVEPATTEVGDPGRSATDPAPAVPPPGSYVPTTVGPVNRTDLPPPLQRVDALAGGDPTESACIRQGLAASLGPAADRPEAYAGAAGTTVVQCLPPAKLAATLVDRLGDPALGLGLDAGKLACARATLATSGLSPEYTVLVGGVALAEAAVIRQGATALDAACGTGLAPAPT